MDAAFKIVCEQRSEIRESPRAQSLLIKFLKVIKDLDNKLSSDEISDVIFHGKVFLLKPKRDFIELHRFLLEDEASIEDSMIYVKKGLAGAIGEAIAYTRFHHFNKTKSSPTDHSN